MRIETSLSPNDYGELKKESKEILGLGGHLSPPFGQSTNDYVEVHLLDTNDGFIEKFISQHTSFEDDKMLINIGQDLRDRDYNRGEFKVQYNFIRRLAGGDEIVLTKTVDGQPNIIHSGNPELTGVPMGKFFTDSEGNAFIGENPPSNMQDAVPLDIKEWKFKVDEISPSRTEVRIVPQLINNSNYINEFRSLIDPKRYIPETAWDEYVDRYVGLKNAWNTIKNNPDDGLSKWWRPRLQFQPNVTKKSEFGKLHWNLFGKDEPNRTLPTQDGGGQISWTGPDSSRLEFNVRREVEDEGFKETMKGSTITIEKAYVVNEEMRPSVEENSEYQQEDAIPELYIQVETIGERNVNFSVRTMDGQPYNPNMDGVQFYFDFGCGHVREASKESEASHLYDIENPYQVSVYVMTPNFQSEVTEMRAIGGRILSAVPLIPAELPEGEVENTETTDETTTEQLPILESAYDGKIIGWNGQGSPAPFYSTGPDRAGTGTRWWVQNGHTRAIQGGVNGTIVALRFLTGIEAEDDIPVPLQQLNDLRLGPNLDSTVMGNPFENEIKRTIPIDWRSPGNPDDPLTNRNAREEQAAIPNTYSVRISGTITIESQGDPLGPPDINTEPLEFPNMIAFTQINSNTTAFETPQYDGDNEIVMRFQEGQSVVLTFPSVVNIGSMAINLSRVDMDGGTTNSSARTASFTMNNDKQITIDYGLQP